MVPMSEKTYRRERGRLVAAREKFEDAIRALDDFYRAFGDGKARTPRRMNKKAKTRAPSPSRLDEAVGTRGANGVDIPRGVAAGVATETIMGMGTARFTCQHIAAAMLAEHPEFGMQLAKRAASSAIGYEVQKGVVRKLGKVAASKGDQHAGRYNAAMTYVLVSVPTGTVGH